MIDHRSEMIREGVLTAPPVTVAGLTFIGVNLSDWLILLSILWLTLQIGYWFYQRYQEWDDKDE